jgi:hypothetical protein
VWALKVDKNTTQLAECARNSIEEYKKLFQMLYNFNEQIIKDKANVDFLGFSIEHQRQLDAVQKAHNDLDEVYQGNYSIGEDFTQFIQDRNLIIEAIKEQEDILKNVVVLELENTKSELTKLQKAKNVLPKYQKHLEQEARFVDKVK